MFGTLSLPRSHFILKVFEPFHKQQFHQKERSDLFKEKVEFLAGGVCREEKKTHSQKQ